MARKPSSVVELARVSGHSTLSVFLARCSLEAIDDVVTESDGISRGNGMRRTSARLSGSSRPREMTWAANNDHRSRLGSMS